MNPSEEFEPIVMPKTINPSHTLAPEVEALIILNRIEPRFINSKDYYKIIRIAMQVLRGEA